MSGAPQAGTDGSSGDSAGSPMGGAEPDGSSALLSGAMTSDERIEALDGQLNESLATFDAMILGERAAVAAIADSSPASTTASGSSAGSGAQDGDGMGGGGPLFEEGDLSEPGGPMGGGMAGSSDAESDADGAGGSSQTSPAATAGLPGRGQGHGPVPPDLVDGSDDDIVARQIREAAMQETDPVLREKLWDEYRKYKQGG